MNVFDLEAVFHFNTTEFEQGINNAKSKISTLGSAVKGGLATAAKVSAVAIGAASAATVAFGKSAVDAGMNFDSSMSQVAATMGTTVDQIGELREFAQKMGSETAFSASQAADALNYMALAGYDASTSMDMLPTVLDLAAAGGIELAAASDMVTDASSALGLSIDETKIMIDQMAVASSKTNTSVAQLGDAILTVGGTAKTLKGGTQELTQVLGLMADNGIKASEAGTHMRNIMLAMTPATNAAAEAWASLGVEAYDSNGQLRNMSDIFGDLSAAMSDMTDQERTDTITAMFNKTDLSAVNALLDTSAERWREVSDAIGDYDGAATKMANTQLDNLAGDITLFQSALEGAQIAVSDGLTPTLREFVQFGSDGLSRLTVAFLDEGVGGAIEELGDLLSEAIEKLAPMIAEGISFVTDALVDITSKLPDVIKKILPSIIETAKSILTSLTDGIRTNIDSITEVAMMIIDFIVDVLTTNLPELLQVALELIVTLALGITQSLPELIPALVDVIVKVVEVLTEPGNLNMVINAAIQIIMAVIEGIIRAIPRLLGPSVQIVVNIVNAVISALPRVLEAAVQLVVTFISGLTSKFGDVSSTGSELFNTVKTSIANRISEAVSWGRDLIDNFIGGIKAKWGALKDTVSSMAQTVKDFIGFSEPKEGPLSNFHTYAPDMMELFAQGIKDNEKLITGQFETSLSNMLVPVKASGKGSQVASGTANYYITVEAGTIGNDYDAYRAAEKISQSLQSLKIRQTKAVGGVTW